jgi:hypothetical protein
VKHIIGTKRKNELQPNDECRMKRLSIIQHPADSESKKSEERPSPRYDYVPIFPPASRIDRSSVNPLKMGFDLTTDPASNDAFAVDDPLSSDTARDQKFDDDHNMEIIIDLSSEIHPFPRDVRRDEHLKLDFTDEGSQALSQSGWTQWIDAFSGFSANTEQNDDFCQPLREEECGNHYEENVCLNSIEDVEASFENGCQFPMLTDSQETREVHEEAVASMHRLDSCNPSKFIDELSSLPSSRVNQYVGNEDQREITTDFQEELMSSWLSVLDESTVGNVLKQQDGLHYCDVSFLRKGDPTVIDWVSLEGDHFEEDVEYFKAFFSCNPKYPHQCQSCLRCYSTLTTLQGHYAFFPTHIETNAIECHFCSQGFNKSSVGDYLHHLVDHLDQPKPFKCQKCTAPMSSMGALTRHMSDCQSKVKSNDLPFSSPQTFKSKDRYVVGSVLFPVTDEKMKFLSESFLGSEERQFQCRICLRTYTQGSTLSHHMRNRHAGKTSHCLQCSFCFEETSQPQKLLEHMASEHANCKTPFKCQTCGSRFVSQSVLHAHISSNCKFPSKGQKVIDEISFEEELLHEDVKYLKKFFLWTPENRHQCSGCLWCFSALKEFRNHISQHPHHENPANLECYFCSFPFDTNKVEDYIRHVVTHNGVQKPFECKQCDRTFARMNHLSLHAHTCIGKAHQEEDEDAEDSDQVEEEEELRLRTQVPMKMKT